jgi:hypothetical protein
MNAGARVAGGEVFWFLHADAEVPPECLNEINRIMRDPTVCGGFFRIRLPEPAVYRLTDSFAHYAGLVLGMRCGDHGIFCRRTAFLEIGGFPKVPLMEDVEFFYQLRRHGRVVHSTQRIAASARRYQAVGPARLTFAYGFIASLYLLGVPLSLLARIYHRACCAPNEQTTSPEIKHSQFDHAPLPCAQRRHLIRSSSVGNMNQEEEKHENYELDCRVDNKRSAPGIRTGRRSSRYQTRGEESRPDN